MINFNFVGELNNANFGEGRTPKKRGENDKMWNPNAAKAHIGVTAALGGFSGYQLGKASSMIKGVKQNNVMRSLGAGGYKRKLLGAAVGGAVLGSAAYLTHKANPQSPIGKGGDRIVKVRDMDGRSDKGKKRFKK
jgi:hypothetical protein